MITPRATLDAVYRRVPALDSLRSYGLADARGDLLAGLTVAAIAVPQAMAYAMVAGLPAQFGLYTAIVMTTVGAIFSSSRQLINGPTNAISIAILSATAMVEPGAKVETAILLAAMVGMLQLGMALFRLGDLSRYVSHSVIIGFTLGAGGLLVLDQLKNLLGIRAAGGAHAHFLVRFWDSLAHGGPVNPRTAAIGLCSIAAVLALRWLKTRLRWPLLPDLLLVVIAAAVIVAGLGLDRDGVAVVGEIPAVLPHFAPPPFDYAHARSFASGALAIAVLGLLEAMAMAKALVVGTKAKLDVNQQCVSEGLANLAGSFFQCFPGSGSLTRSAINQQAGASTQWSGVVSAAAVAAIMVAFAPFARYVPRAALAGILIVTSYKMIDWRGLRYHLRSTSFDAAIVLVTAASAIVISVEFCVLIGVFLSFLLAVPRAGRMLLTEFVVGAEGQIEERLPSDTACERILIFGLEGEMFFGASAAIEEHLGAIEQRIGPRTRVVVVRLKRARNPDAVGLTLLDGFLDRVAARGVEVLLCGVRQEFAEKLERVGASLRLGKNLFLEEPVRMTSTSIAVKHAYTLIPDRCVDCPIRERDPSARAYRYII